MKMDAFAFGTTQWADVENQSEAQIRDCFAGKMSVKDAIDAVEKVVIDAVGL